MSVMRRTTGRAIWIVLRWNGKIYFYQSGRKMDVPNQVRPGIALHAETIRSAIAEGLREYDFMGGSAQYKSQLAPAARQLVRLRVQKTWFREKILRTAEYCIAKLRPLRKLIQNTLSPQGKGPGVVESLPKT